MRKIIYCLLCVLFVFSSCKEQRYDVYLCIGQSNMAGRGEMESQDTLAMDNVFILNDKDIIVPASAPLNLYSTVRKSVSMQGFNPVYSFSKKMASLSKRPILLVVNARGGTTISEWLPNEKILEDSTLPSLFNEAVRRCKIATEYGDLKAILWHQGESDSSDSTVFDYMPKLTDFVHLLRNELGVGEEIPFVAGEVCYQYFESENINAILNTISENIPNSYCVSAKDCPVGPDSLHFTREGQIILGERYADAVIALSK